MRYLLIICLLAFSTTFSHAKGQFPDFQLSLYKQQVEISNQDLSGKVLYVDFWASWCGPCRKTFPFMNELQAEFSDQEFQIVAVNMDELVEDADKFLERYPAEFPIYRDAQNKLAKELNLPGLPTAYIVDKKGVIRAVHTGFKERTKGKTLKQIRYLVEEE